MVDEPAPGAFEEPLPRWRRTVMSIKRAGELPHLTYTPAMRHRFLTLGYAAALATSPAWLTACSTSDDAAASSEEPTVLFSLTADTVRFEDPQGTEATLVMEGVDPHAIWFTDRPERESGMLTTGRLADEWGEGQSFAEDPPNAAVVLHQPIQTEEGVAETLVVEMLDAQYDEAKKTFRADLRVLEDEERGAIEGNLVAHADRHDVAWPSEGGEVSLFIDSITLCTTPDTCNDRGSTNYTYNSTIYYQINISQNVSTASMSHLSEMTDTDSNSEG